MVPRLHPICHHQSAGKHGQGCNFKFDYLGPIITKKIIDRTNHLLSSDKCLHNAHPRSKLMVNSGHFIQQTHTKIQTDQNRIILLDLIQAHKASLLLSSLISLKKQVHYTRCHKARLILLLLVYETELTPLRWAFFKSTPFVVFLFATVKGVCSADKHLMGVEENSAAVV